MAADVPLARVLPGQVNWASLSILCTLSFNEAVHSSILWAFLPFAVRSWGKPANGEVISSSMTESSRWPKLWLKPSNLSLLLYAPHFNIVENRNCVLGWRFIQVTEIDAAPTVLTPHPNTLAACTHLYSCFFVSQAITTPMWGWVSDRFGRRPVILSGLLGTALGMGIFAFSPSFNVACVGRILVGSLNGNLAVRNHLCMNTSLRKRNSLTKLT